MFFSEEARLSSAEVTRASNGPSVEYVTHVRTYGGRRKIVVVVATGGDGGCDFQSGELSMLRSSLVVRRSSLVARRRNAAIASFA